VLLSVLIGMDPPRLPTRLLVATTELFGIADGTARTALSRMVAAGDVVAGDGWHEAVAPRLLDRQRQQAEGRAARTEAWRDRAWWTAVVTAERRPAGERAELRAGLRAARLAELREGVWLRPDNLGWRQAPTARWPLTWFRSRPDGDDRALAASLWDLADWSATATSLRVRLAGFTAPLEAGDRSALAPGFVVSAAVLRHLRADPLLPTELLPAGWPGPDLRSDYERFDAAYRAVLRDWFDEHP
jgi:phenylacetic acid degradation operon negative regulatory protein